MSCSSVGNCANTNSPLFCIFLLSILSSSVYCYQGSLPYSIIIQQYIKLSISSLRLCYRPRCWFIEMYLLSPFTLRLSLKGMWTPSFMYLLPLPSPTKYNFLELLFKPIMNFFKEIERCRYPCRCRNSSRLSICSASMMKVGILSSVA